MGLDIWLERFEDFDDAMWRMEEYEKYSEEVWNFENKKYEELTEEEKAVSRAKCKKKKEELGTDGCSWEAIGVETIEIDSELNPDHLFKIGYFRSSYNDSGINRFLEQRIGMTLDTLFCYQDGEYYFQPDWNDSRNRLVAALSELRKFREKHGSFFIEHIGANLFCPDHGPKSNEEALAVFIDHTESHKEGCRSYSCKDGRFRLDGMTVLAAIPGFDCFKMPTVYLISKMEEGDSKWYEDAIEIMIETVDYVLKQPDQEKYYLCWSR